MDAASLREPTEYELQEEEKDENFVSEFNVLNVQPDEDMEDVSTAPKKSYAAGQQSFDQRTF